MKYVLISSCEIFFSVWIFYVFNWFCLIMVNRFEVIFGEFEQYCFNIWKLGQTTNCNNRRSLILTLSTLCQLRSNWIKLGKLSKSEIPEYHLEGLIPVLVFNHKELFYTFSNMEKIHFEHKLDEGRSKG